MDFTTLTAWGFNGNGQLGNGTTNSSTPVEVSDLVGVEAIAAGGSHNLALKNDGTVWAWGANVSGALGNESITHHSSTPVQVSEVGGIEAIATHSGHSLALNDGGTVWAWGVNRNGELGNGSTTNSSTPVQVSDLVGVKAIAAGGSHSLAVQ